MIVYEDGTVFGTIGGGCAEARTGTDRKSGDTKWLLPVL